MVSTIKLDNKLLAMLQFTAGDVSLADHVDKNYFDQGAKSLIFRVENGLKMLC